MSNNSDDSVVQELLNQLLQAVAQLAQSSNRQNEAVAQLAQSSNRQNEKLDFLTDHVGHLARSSNRQNEKLDILIDQVGHFTEGLAELKILVQEQAETARQQAEVARIQAENVAQLIALASQK